MTIALTGIEALEDSHYRIDLDDGGEHVSFVLEVDENSVEITEEFADFCLGRTSAREAFEALHAFVQGKPVSFPVKVTEDGFDGMG